MLCNLVAKCMVNIVNFMILLIILHGVEGDMVSGERQVLSLVPCNKHDLSMRSFADRQVFMTGLMHMLNIWEFQAQIKTFKHFSTAQHTTSGEQLMIVLNH